MRLLYELTNHVEGIASPEEVIQDAGRRYNNTYMLLKLRGQEPTLEYIRQISANFIQIWREPDLRNPIPYDTIERLEPFMPQVGYYQFDKGGLFLNKNITRQWRRSYSEDTYRTIKWGQCSLNDFITQPRQFKYSLNEIDADSPKIALSPHLACKYASSYKAVTLFYDEVPIAKIKPKKKVIELFTSDLFQEVKDYLFKNQLGDVWKIQTE